MLLEILQNQGTDCSYRDCDALSPAEAGHDVQAADGDLPEAAAGHQPPVHRVSRQANRLRDWKTQQAVLNGFLWAPILSERCAMICQDAGALAV